MLERVTTSLVEEIELAFPVVVCGVFPLRRTWGEREARIFPRAVADSVDAIGSIFKLLCGASSKFDRSD